MLKTRIARIAVASLALALVPACHCGREEPAEEWSVTEGEQWYEPYDSRAELAEPGNLDRAIKAEASMREAAIADYQRSPSHGSRLRLAAAYFPNLGGHFQEAQAVDFRMAAGGIFAEYEIPMPVSGPDGGGFATPGREKRLSAKLPFNSCDPLKLSWRGETLEARRLNGKCESAQPGL